MCKGVSPVTASLKQTMAVAVVSLGKEQLCLAPLAFFDSLLKDILPTKVVPLLFLLVEGGATEEALLPRLLLFSGDELSLSFARNKSKFPAESPLPVFSSAAGPVVLLFLGLRLEGDRSCSSLSIDRLISMSPRGDVGETGADIETGETTADQLSEEFKETKRGRKRELGELLPLLTGLGEEP